MDDDLPRLSATQVLHRLQRGDLTVEAYARSLLARIRARDPIVQAWSYLDAELVLAQARKLDQIPQEKRGPLHGIAIGIKDVALTQGTFLDTPVYI
jgi:Asp-tRNA(Asn)/Glu-tRNA(Gln) amidotransferase A subunit family amidase